jgi:hypothetical protein
MVLPLVVHLGHPRPHRCAAPSGVLAAMLLLAFGPPAHAAWTPASTGSWVVIEAWKHGLGEEHVARTTTTLVKWVNGAPWFEHVDEKGNRWEDADPGTGNDSDMGTSGEGHDTFVTRQSLRLDDRPIPCRVIVNEQRTEPWSTSDPVSYWLSRTKRWETVDTTVRVRVLKVLDLGTETHYRGGRVETRDGVITRTIKTLHEPVRQHGRTYDCWVLITKTLADDGSFAGRTTVWGCEQVPTGWVRRIRETRDARNGAMARLQEQLVDFRVK